jgi:hypothetical protein
VKYVAAGSGAFSLGYRIKLESGRRLNGAPFNGTSRDTYLSGKSTSNAGGSKLWWTDPYGGHAQAAPFPGGVGQPISRTDTDQSASRRRSSAAIAPTTRRACTRQLVPRVRNSRAAGGAGSRRTPQSTRISDSRH